jgi:hypothetical protein
MDLLVDFIFGLLPQSPIAHVGFYTYKEAQSALPRKNASPELSPI